MLNYFHIQLLPLSPSSFKIIFTTAIGHLCYYIETNAKCKSY